MSSQQNKIKIKREIIEYLKSGNPIISELKRIPLDQSLVELGYLDSFGVVELVSFIEKNFNVVINDDEITKEKFGSINKMTNLIENKKSSKW